MRETVRMRSVDLDQLQRAPERSRDPVPRLRSDFVRLRSITESNPVPFPFRGTGWTERSRGRDGWNEVSGTKSLHGPRLQEGSDA